MIRDYRLRQCLNKLLVSQQKQQRYVPSKGADGNEFVGYIPIDKIEKRFMRSSGPGGQNVNMVNTKCQIRFNLNEADWLSPEIKEVFRKRFVRLLSKQNDVVISSDKSRIQAENQEDCFEKLQALLTECNKELLDNRLPTDQDKAIIDNRAIKAAQRRLYAKRIQSQKKKSRDPCEFL
ncbi:RF-1 domain family protein [Brugia pahangi]